MGRFHEQVMGVYFDDLDAFQILHNARYLLLFERTLGSLWEAWGMHDQGLEAQAEHWHLVRTNRIEYKAPMRGVGKVRVRVWVGHLGRTSMVFSFRVMRMDADEDYAVGERVVVHVGEDGRPSPWSDALRAKIAPYVMDATDVTA